MKSIEISNWQEHLENMICLTDNEPVELLNEVLLNTFTNFTPNKVKTVRPHEAPWITKNVKTTLRRKNHDYRNFMSRGQPNDKPEGIQKMISEGGKLIEDAKRNNVLKSAKL